jgi:ABC-type microcin C transport system duplicated ATPase subunit YejF
MSTRAVRQARKPALIRVKELCKSYEQRTSWLQARKIIPVLQDVELEIMPECTTALVGSSGCGKSTLALCLAGLRKADAGEIWFDGKEISQLNAREMAPLRPQIQLVFQDSAGALNPRMTAAEIIAEPLEIQQIAKGPELYSRARTAIEEVGLPDDCRDRRTLELSGGQRQRLAVARALVLQPKLLILDESLSGLDLITQAQILALLLELQRKHGVAYLMISHDLSLIGQIADFVAVMQNGKVVEQGTRQEVFTSPRHTRTQEFLASAQALESSFRELQTARLP